MEVESAVVHPPLPPVNQENQEKKKAQRKKTRIDAPNIGMKESRNKELEIFFYISSRHTRDENESKYKKKKE